MLIFRLPSYVKYYKDSVSLDIDNKTYILKDLLEQDGRVFNSIQDFFLANLNIPNKFITEYSPDEENKIEYFYRIKTPHLNTKEYWAWKPFEIGYIKAENRQEARKLLEEHYGINFCLRAIKKDIGDKHFYFLQLFEKDERYEKFWHSDRECKYCGNTFTKFDRDKAFGFDNDIDEYYCSSGCEKQFKEEYVENDLKKYDYDGNDYAVIYKIINIKTNKCYIGKTTQAYTYRWHQHMNSGASTKFQEALYDYEITDWEFSIVEKFDFRGKDIDYNDSKGYAKLLSEREQYWIHHFDSLDNGYNSVVANKDMDIILKGKNQKEKYYKSNYKEILNKDDENNIEEIEMPF